MSPIARRNPYGEAHRCEPRIVESPARAWAGRVRITAQHGVLEIPGTWHLHMPAHGRKGGPGGRALLPLPEPGKWGAWREHLLRLVTLQLPGAQLRVCRADRAGWRMLEFSAPTAPASVLQLDREALGALLGPDAHLDLSIGRRLCPPERAVLTTLPEGVAPP